MKSFIISICILILIGVYIVVASAYFLDTEQHVSCVLDEIEHISVSENIDSVTISDRLETLCDYLKDRNKILSLYIHRTKCTEAEFLLEEIRLHSKSGNEELFSFAMTKLRELLRDIRENDALVTFNGIM